MAVAGEIPEGDGVRLGGSRVRNRGLERPVAVSQHHPHVVAQLVAEHEIEYSVVSQTGRGGVPRENPDRICGTEPKCSIAISEQYLKSPARSPINYGSNIRLPVAIKVADRDGMYGARVTDEKARAGFELGVR